MRVLVVTPYPPVRDGIAAYALQQVRALRRTGHDVEVLSPRPSAAHHHLDLVGPRGGLALAKRVRDYDRVIVQFHPDFFYPVPSTARQRTAVAAAYAAAFAAARSVDVYVHEIDYRYGRGWAPDAVAARAMWRAVDRIHVHTETERRDFAAGFGVATERIILATHGENFARRTLHTRASARRSLGIDAGTFVFLSIGFLQPHKGFDRGIRAFAGLADRGARYDVVGSVRVAEPAYVAHLGELRSLAAATDGVQLHEGYLSDEMFDRWLVACDLVVLPYRSIWSSGVLERAALYDRLVVATDVGGLAEQMDGREGITLVTDDAELRAALAAALGASAPRRPTRPWPDPTDLSGPELRDRVQVEVRARAAGGADRHPEASSDPAATGRAGTAALRRIAPLQLPATGSHRSGTALLKRAVRRLTAWQLEPVVGHVNAMQAATVEAIERSVAADTTGGSRSVGSIQAELPDGGSQPAGASAID